MFPQDAHFIATITLLYTAICYMLLTLVITLKRLRNHLAIWSIDIYKWQNVARLFLDLNNKYITVEYLYFIFLVVCLFNARSKVREMGHIWLTYCLDKVDLYNVIWIPVGEIYIKIWDSKPSVGRAWVFS